MMSELFEGLSAMLSSSPGIAVVASFLWGVASIIFSPCHLASIPLVVGYIDSQGGMNTSRAALVSTLFSGGILITIAAIGVITGLAGRMMGDIGIYGNAAVAAIMLIFGLYLLGVMPIPFLSKGFNTPGIKRKGLFAAFVLGLFFGIALGPCTFAFMAPMLGVAFAVASDNLLYSSALIAAYALGHCIIIVLAGSFSQTVQRVLNWNEKSKGLLYMKRVCGLLVIAAGVYMLIKL